ncbi:hypothetical protein [Serratia bockelmannii]|uniref:hypothetical protein n=1 Tax=Serratia bockelmannii TaxID=2703793 RepID=UPI003CE96194
MSSRKELANAIRALSMDAVQINPARPTHSEKSAFWRFFRFCLTHCPYLLILSVFTTR